MERKEYLNMCQKASCYPENYGIRQVPEDLWVVYKDMCYYPQAYELAFDNGKIIHKAILHDLKANAIVYCDLARVEKWIETK